MLRYARMRERQRASHADATPAECRHAATLPLIISLLPCLMPSFTITTATPPPRLIDVAMLLPDAFFFIFSACHAHDAAAAAAADAAADCHTTRLRLMPCRHAIF